MNAVIYYSNTGESREIAEYVARHLDFPLLDMLSLNSLDFEELVVVFPVHCQNIPKAVKPILKRIRAERTALLVTYGKMSYGNVLRESQRYFKNIVFGAYIPTKHTYLNDDSGFKELSKLNAIRDSFAASQRIKIAKGFKNPLANLFMVTRSRLGVHIKKSDRCTSCGACKAACRSEKCIRCLKCVKVCPRQALSFTLNPFMSLYLKKKKINKLVVYKGE